MNAPGGEINRVKRLFGWIGIICLLLIIPIKATRFVSVTAARTMFVGIAPSLLGPAGLLFIILSSSGRLARLSLVQATVLVAVIALGLEFVQLLPRPGFLAYVHYTFDWLDLIASAVSVCIASLVAVFLMKLKRTRRDPTG